MLLKANSEGSDHSCVDVQVYSTAVSNDSESWQLRF